MFTTTHFFKTLKSYLPEVIGQTTQRGKKTWEELIRQHPSDIAVFIDHLPAEQQANLLNVLPNNLVHKTFERMNQQNQLALLPTLSTEKTTMIMHQMRSDDLVDLLEHIPDEELSGYLHLIQKKQRERIRSQLSFPSKSAGSIMNSDVITLTSDLTVQRSIALLQRLSNEKEVTYRLYVVDKNTFLIGHITLDMLVTHKPETFLKDLYKNNEVVINAMEDQEQASRKMKHYGIPSAPVVDEEGYFLGAITTEDVYDVMEEEASEDVYKMSGVGDVEHGYFDTPLLQMISQRSRWLIGLLLFQSISGYIMSTYEDMLQRHVIISLFLTMLIGTGGNAGNQSATLVIRGLATGAISLKKGVQVLLREGFIGTIIAFLLSAVAFCRVYITHHDLTSAFAISISLFLIVLTSILLGSIIPLLLEKCKIDPAHSAAPFLATLMDIIGILIYCSICSQLL